VIEGEMWTIIIGTFKEKPLKYFESMTFVNLVQYHGYNVYMRLSWIQCIHAVVMDTMYTCGCIYPLYRPTCGCVNKLLQLKIKSNNNDIS